MEFQTRYEFNPKKDLLGKGGFSKVYKANDTLLDRTVALKLFMANTSEKYQVLSEIKKVIQFEHPNLCKYYDVAVLNNTNIFGEIEKTEVGIMEYLDAGDLKTYINNHPQSADKLLIDVLKGLSYLHKKGIVHRDLKPQNILVKMVDDEPVAKITDFGISKLINSEDNNSSALIGTIEYMAPEQFNPKKYGIGGRITTNLDLWSFGLLVYEVVFHKSLFGRRSDGTSAEQVMRNILSDSWSAKIDALPLKYRAIVNRCLVKNASDRVQNAFELIPLFSNDFIHAENIIVEKVKSPEENKPLITDPATDQPEQEDYDGDTMVIEKTEQSPGVNMPVHQSEEEFTVEQIPVPPAEEEPKTDDTQVIDGEPNVPDENTEVQYQNEETTNDNTTLIEPEREDIYDNDTQVIQLEQDVTASNPELLQLKQELPDAVNIPNPGPDEKQARLPRTETTSNKLIQKEEHHEKKIVINNISSKRRSIYAITLGLIITAFFLYRFITADKPEAEVEKIQKTEKTPPIEQSSLIAMPELIQIEGGNFSMGSESDEATQSELPAHLVNLDNFSIGKYEVTVDQFRQFITDSKYITTAEKEGTSDIYKNGQWQAGKSINWRHDQSGNLPDTSIKNTPVVHVSWTDVNEYCKWLSKKTNQTYRLPTEAEWEYAAKGGKISKSSKYSGNNSIEKVAWYLTNSNEKIHAIGQKQANELGIFDMSGNVMEWCYDWYEEDFYSKSGRNNPTGPASGTARAVRGGSWFLDDKTWFRNSFRAGFPPTVRGGQIGFRICRSEGSDSTVKVNGQLPGR